MTSIQDTTTGQYLSPVEFRKALEDDDTVIIDARNDYEFDLGHFRGAIRPNITRFRDLPDWIKENKALFADKKWLRTVLVAFDVKIFWMAFKRRISKM